MAAINIAALDGAANLGTLRLWLIVDDHQKREMCSVAFVRLLELSVGTNMLKWLLVSLLSISTLFEVILSTLVCKYMNQKPFGMQTPFDQMVKDLVIVQSVTTLIASSITIGWLPIQDCPVLILTLLYAQLFSFVYLLSQLLFTVLVRYLYIFHSSWINDVDDFFCIYFPRLINANVALALTAFEFFSIDLKQSFEFHFLRGVNFGQPQDVDIKSLKVMIIIVSIAVIYMLFSIELKKASLQKRLSELGHSFWSVRFMALLTLFGGLLTTVYIYGLVDLTDTSTNLPKLALHSVVSVILHNLLPLVVILGRPKFMAFCGRTLAAQYIHYFFVLFKP